MAGGNSGRVTSVWVSQMPVNPHSCQALRADSIQCWQKLRYPLGSSLILPLILAMETRMNYEAILLSENSLPRWNI